jgi:riboflavin kinase/FMN adenylyltransferase
MKTAYTGIIIKGSKKASSLGFPTANIVVSDKISGIYAGRVLVKNAEYRAALFGDEKRGLLEAYILDFSGNLYGERTTFMLEKKIRAHGVFTNDEILKKQIATDIEEVRKYFASKGSEG